MNIFDIYGDYPIIALIITIILMVTLIIAAIAAGMASDKTDPKYNKSKHIGYSFLAVLNTLILIFSCIAGNRSYNKNYRTSYTSDNDY